MLQSDKINEKWVFCLRKSRTVLPSFSNTRLLEPIYWNQVYSDTKTIICWEKKLEVGVKPENSGSFFDDPMSAASMLDLDVRFVCRCRCCDQGCQARIFAPASQQWASHLKLSISQPAASSLISEGLSAELFFSIFGTNYKIHEGIKY